MNEQDIKQAWSVWIDESKKVISIKENPAGKEIFFENRDMGIKAVTELVSKGYKIGQPKRTGKSRVNARAYARPMTNLFFLRHVG